MKKAIILGVTGTVGQTVAKYFIKKGIDVCGIARTKNFSVSNDINEKFKYISADINTINNINLQNEVKGWINDAESVVLNFIWRGNNKLRDGILEQQIKNVYQASSAIEFAKNIGSNKFIQVGTQDESIFEEYLTNEHWKEYPYPSDLLNYASAKFFTKEMNQITSYINKIDYVHTRFSAVVARDLNDCGYIPQTLKKIKQKENYEPPMNQQLYEILLLEDLAEMYYIVANYGENKKDYYLGYGKPRKLRDFFADFKCLVEGEKLNNINVKKCPKIFNNELLKDLCDKANSQVAEHDFSLVAKRILQ